MSTHCTAGAMTLSGISEQRRQFVFILVDDKKSTISGDGANERNYCTILSLTFTGFLQLLWVGGADQTNGAPKHLRHHCTLLLGGLSMGDRTLSCSALSSLYARRYSRLNASVREKQS